MAKIAKMESQVDIKSSAEKFYQAFKNKQTHMAKMSPNVVKDVLLLKGGWGSIGSITKWIFAPAGDSLTTEYCTMRIEAADDEKKLISFSCPDGDVTKLYNNYKVTIEATDKANGSGAVLKTTIEYEKKNEAVPEPSMYFNFAALLYKGIDAFLINNA